LFLFFIVIVLPERKYIKELIFVKVNTLSLAGKRQCEKMAINYNKMQITVENIT